MGKIDILLDSMNKVSKECNSQEEFNIIFNVSNTVMLGIHAKALACHCECLAMNAENCASACANQVPPFDYHHYIEVMEKWEVMDKKLKPII